MTDLRDPKYAIRKIATLLQRHDDYNAKRQAWATLSDIHKGSSAVMGNIAKYLPMKPAEEVSVYEGRLKNASYSPLLANTLRETVNKLTSAPLHVKGGDTPYWSKIRQSFDGKAQDEKDLIESIFTYLLYYGTFYAVVYRPDLDTQPTSSADDTKLFENGYHSRVKILHPLNVVNWGDDWYLTQDVYKTAQPLEPETLRCRWTLYGAYASWVYDVECKATGDAVTHIKVGTEWLSVSDPNMVIDGFIVPHGLTRCPVITLSLEAHHWVGDLAANQQMRHLRIESQLNESGMIAGSVVRVFTPTPPIEESASAIMRRENHDENPALKMPGAYTLVGNDYKFVESTGQAIGSLLALLDKIERYLRAVGSLDFKASDTSRQSNESKQTDMSLLENEMMFLGAKAVKIYQDLVDNISEFDGQPRPLVEGLQNYGINNISVMLEQSVVMESVQPRLPSVALRLWYTRLATLMTGQTFGAVEEVLQAEVEAIYSQPLEAIVAPPSPPSVSNSVLV